MSDTGLEVKATFKKCTIADEKTEMIFTLSPRFVGMLPDLSRLVGQSVYLGLTTEQLAMEEGREDGGDGSAEPIDGQTAIEDAEPAEPDFIEPEYLPCYEVPELPGGYES